MTWLPLALAVALLYGIQGAWSKRLTRRVSPLAAAWALFAFALPALAGYLVVEGIPEVSARFWPAAGATAALSLVSFYLYVSALQVGELGLTYPILALTPLFAVPVEWVLLGDLPGPAGLLGLLLLVAGVYLLNSDARGGPLAPLAAVARDRGARRMLAVALLWSVSGVVDKVAVTAASTPFYGTVLTGALCLGFLPLLSRKGGGIREALRPGARTGMVVQGLLFGLMFIAQMEALQRTLATYVLGIKRSGALVTVVLGALFFGERELGRRAAGTLVLLVGMALIALA